MPPLQIPFKYRDNLIGEEIVFRALKQQESFANSGRYGMTWSQQDVIARNQAFYQASILRTDFDTTGFEHCVPEPPCPWPKDSDDLNNAHFKPIITGNDGVYTYSFKVAERTDTAAGFDVGKTLVDYSPDQTQLDIAIQAEFAYHAKSGDTDYRGKAIIVITKQHRGQTQATYYYLFNLVD